MSDLIEKIKLLIYISLIGFIYFFSKNFSRMNIPHLQNDSKHIDIRRLKVNAQITALITLIEFLGNLTLLLHLYFVESNPWTATIQS